jgi:hypothetical protein
MNQPSLSPTAHPNAYAGVLTGTVTAMLLYEAKKRLGLELDGIEQSYISVGVAALALYLAGKKTKT